MEKFRANPGDLVRVVAPAGKGSSQNLPRITEYIESLGLVAQITDNIYDQDEPFYSNFDEFRANDLISAILDDNCKIIWCIRGGAGCNRLIKYLDERLPTEPPPTPKLLIGYSDITVLHIYLHKKYNWPTLHGAMLEAVVNGSYDPDSNSIRFLLELIFNRITTVCYSELTRLDEGAQPTLPIAGAVVGGNLTLVEASIGTNWEINTEDKILFIEDISVAAYSLERSLSHMVQVGMFEKAKAVIFGDFTSADSQQLIQFVQQRFATDPLINCPVFVLPGIGHGDVNLPLPLNTSAEIKYVEGLNAYQLCDAAQEI
ncbi:hypothetical protein Ocin01_04785 [Orchesella cincta]|uniref:LD-carboxypeptidase n=1 Tax=Orchesella cincta TaxID=48709 RepID=A0A1D2N9Y0_ORCCI|nr:hypothetical protein Ocin01_04785 [Orchesella cincta]